MPLLLTEKDTFEVAVKYTEADGGLKFFEKDWPEDAKEEKFTFRWPCWSDTRIMLTGAVSVDQNGSVTVDPYKFMDGKLRILIKDWTLKNEKGDKIQCTDKNIDKLHPALFDYLNQAIEAKLTGKFQTPKV